MNLKNFLDRMIVSFATSQRLFDIRAKLRRQSAATAIQFQKELLS